MRKTILTLVLIVSLTTPALAHDNAHFAVSGVLGGFSLMAVDIIKPEWSTPKKVLIASLIALTLGLVKELTDDHFSWRDMGSNAMGAFSVTPMIATITLRW